MCKKVGFLFILLKEILFSFIVSGPVNMLNIISGDISTVTGKFNSKTVKGRTVVTDQITLNGETLNDVQINASGNSYTIEDNFSCADFTLTAGTFYARNNASSAAYNMDLASLTVNGGLLDASYGSPTITVSGNVSISSGATYANFGAGCLCQRTPFV